MKRYHGGDACQDISHQPEIRQQIANNQGGNGQGNDKRHGHNRQVNREHVCDIVNCRFESLGCRYFKTQIDDAGNVSLADENCAQNIGADDRCEKTANYPDH